MQNTTATKFIVGATYGTASICDSDCIFYMTVISRTEKTATIQQDIYSTPRRFKIHIEGDEESIRMGNYSMASSWGAKSDLITPAEETPGAPVTIEEMAASFSLEELQFIKSAFEDALTIPTEELPANCVPFRKMA
jgi:hypothetical protein